MFPNDGLARRRRIGEALARGDRPRWARARRTNKRLQMPPPLSAAQQAHEEMMAMQEWFDGGHEEEEREEEAHWFPDLSGSPSARRALRE